MIQIVRNHKSKSKSKRKKKEKTSRNHHTYKNPDTCIKNEMDDSIKIRLKSRTINDLLIYMNVMIFDLFQDFEIFVINNPLARKEPYLGKGKQGFFILKKRF